jgi:murein L,D-transpeptidase YafK
LARFVRGILIFLSAIMVMGLIVLAVSSRGSFGKEPKPIDGTASHLRLEKSERRLTLYDGDRMLKGYRVALGFAPEGPKTRQGDGRTPEGRYVIDFKNAKSKFHLSLRISYPDEDDRARAEGQGLEPGGDIYIHGLPKGTTLLNGLHTLRDWTLGCIAVTNPEIEEIWRAVPVGTPIEIVP